MIRNFMKAMKWIAIGVILAYTVLVGSLGVAISHLGSAIPDYRIAVAVGLFGVWMIYDTIAGAHAGLNWLLGRRKKN